MWRNLPTLPTLWRNLLKFQVSISVQYQLNHHWIIFYCSFCLEVINQIPIETNLYHDQVNQGKNPKANWILVTMQEIKAFLGINIEKMRKICVTCAYQKKADGKQKKTKTSNFCKKCCLFAKHVLPCAIP